ncbi:MAG: hypothetical protein Q4E89_13400, partial [Eubacteriales bacterium]|nr:hypothetical protein [Eubacteriales bacterium]
MRKKSRLKALLLSAGLTVSLIGSMPVYCTENIPDESASGESFSQDTAAADTAGTIVDETVSDSMDSDNTSD